MMSFKVQKRKYEPQNQVVHGRVKNKTLESKTNLISMNEARQIAEHVFSGIAWSG